MSRAIRREGVLGNRCSAAASVLAACAGARCAARSFPARRSADLLSSVDLEPLIDALWTGLALIYTPPLLDILPMYVLFMLASPLALTIGLQQNGWYLVIGVSM